MEVIAPYTSLSLLSYTQKPPAQPVSYPILATSPSQLPHPQHNQAPVLLLTQFPFVVIKNHPHTSLSQPQHNNELPPLHLDDILKFSSTIVYLSYKKPILSHTPYQTYQ